VAGYSRLAADCGVASSTICRLARNQISPSYALALAVTEALSRRMGVWIDMRDVFAPRSDFRFPTACVCDLSPSCMGCFPDEAYDADDNLRYAYKDLRPGDWCRYLPLETPLTTSTLVSTP
jgi:DNA-binding XRE family transcriptional regulator